jgi:carboxymethylenebutenolidase
VIEAGKAPVLGVFGERDHTISVDDVLRLRSTLESAGRSYEFVIEPDLPHGWLNPTMPGRFRSEAADRTWRLMLDFTDRALLGPGVAGVSWSFRAAVSADYDFAANVRVE